jgi:hypothetical protein
MNKYTRASLPGLITILLLITSALQAWAWGKTGHRAIAEIAYQQLTPTAKLKIATLLGDNYLPLYATWADDIRSDPANPLSKAHHYANMELDESYEQSNPKDDDIVHLLNQMIDKVDNQDTPAEDKVIALKFIIHLVGDIHQPLHLGTAEDLGGNLIDVKWFDEETNLHKLWDDDLIDFSRLSYTELARFAGTPGENERNDILNKSVVQWIDETHEQTRMIYQNIGNKDYNYLPANTKSRIPTR